MGAIVVRPVQTDVQLIGGRHILVNLANAVLEPAAQAEVRLYHRGALFDRKLSPYLSIDLERGENGLGSVCFTNLPCGVFQVSVKWRTRKPATTEQQAELRKANVCRERVTVKK